MVNVTIDGIAVSVPKQTTIMKAAKRIGIEIPHLCYLEGINEISACKVCVVEIQGLKKLVTACNSPVEDGMVIYTNSPRVRKARRINVELILSQHDCHCAACVRSGNCNLQKLSNDLGILEVVYQEQVERIPWNQNFPLIRDSRKCIKCMRCVQICEKIQAVHVWDVQNTGSRTTVDVAGNLCIEQSNCTLCGQCITHCPTGALRERSDLNRVLDALADPEKVTVVQVAPAVRTAWGEEMGLFGDEASEGRLVSVLKRIGFDYIFDTNFAADLTIMEEASELIAHLSEPEKHSWPMFTSCCPGWVQFVKKKYPKLLSQLSTAKSPQQMFGAVAKSYFAQKKGIDPANIVSISIMPCVAKKQEAAARQEKGDKEAEVDIVLTTRELIRLIRSEHINPRFLDNKPWDSPLGESTGAGVIFGVTGGVMEAALRTAYQMTQGKNPSPNAFSKVRKTVAGKDTECWQAQGRREAQFQMGELVLNTCTVSGLANAQALIEDLLQGRVSYDFVEVMACPGGCVSGGGQPIHDGQEYAAQRGNCLYQLEAERPIRFSHENAQVLKLYDEFLGKPLGPMAHTLLHTEHIK